MRLAVCSPSTRLWGDWLDVRAHELTLPKDVADVILVLLFVGALGYFGIVYVCGSRWHPGRMTKARQM